MKWNKRWTADGELLRSKASQPKGYKISQPANRDKRFYAQMITTDGWRPVERDDFGRPKTYRTEAAAKRACEKHAEVTA